MPLAALALLPRVMAVVAAQAAVKQLVAVQQPCARSQQQQQQLGRGRQQVIDLADMMQLRYAVTRQPSGWQPLVVSGV
jgi:hypothetical protein